MARIGVWVLGVSLALCACSGGSRWRAANDAGELPDDGEDGLGDGAIGAGEDGSTRDHADAGDAGTGQGGSSGDGSLPFPINDAGQVLCSGVVCACSDGIDGDADGLVDLADPECVSAWDNDEATFATGISGDNRDDACQDCFFDGNSGSGNDGCRIPSSCLRTGQPTSGQGSCSSCEASDQCKSFCADFTPNGCDCFGCCTVQLGSNLTKNILLGAGCDIDGTDLSGCVECVPSTTCVNGCGRCELCPGKTAADLPSDCGSGAGGGDAGTSTPTPTCDEGEARCGEGLPACGVGEACTFGCCILAPVVI